MENHPIPQDVTGFKFKLIGSVTIKQFLYLLGMGILAVVVFIMPFPFLVRLPFMIIFASIGIGLAFVPIDGRPMDTMIINFAKAVPAENRFIYRKKGVIIPAFEFVRIVTPKTPQQLQTKQTDETEGKKALFMRQLQKSYTKPDKRELELLNNIKGFFEESAVTRGVPHVNADEMPVSSIKLTKPAPRPKTESGEHQQEVIAKATPAPANVQTAMSQEEQNKQINEQIKTNSGQAADTTGIQQEEEPKNAKAVSPQTQVQAGFPTIPDIPNIIMGIVKDPRGRILQNILVEVLDQNNIPVRAFKTNALGQFASATPLPNGTYKLYLEDPQKKNEFETIEAVMNGEIFNPIEIFSVDSREKLRQELFGGKAPQQPTGA